MIYRVTLNGKIYEVEVADGEAVLLDSYEASQPVPSAAPQPAAPAQSGPSLAAGEVVKAPMPGNILQITVQPGQRVQAGQVLLTLEAMKMENEIVAPRDGTVAQIVAVQGKTVDTGAPLLVLS